MKKREMQEIFKRFLEDQKLRLKQAVEKGDDGALMIYGTIWGIAESMRKMELIDYDQMSFIKDEAWAIYTRKEPDNEAC